MYVGITRPVYIQTLYNDMKNVRFKVKTGIFRFLDNYTTTALKNMS